MFTVSLTVFYQNCFVSASSVAAAQATSDQPKEHKTASQQPSPDVEISKGDPVGEGTSKHETTVSPSHVFAEQNNNRHIIQKSVTRSVAEVSSKVILYF